VLSERKRNGGRSSPNERKNSLRARRKGPEKSLRKLSATQARHSGRDTFTWVEPSLEGRKNSMQKQDRAKNPNGECGVQGRKRRYANEEAGGETNPKT